MKDYAKLWLDHKEKKANRDCTELKKFTFSGADKDDVIVKNASAELKNGLTAMLSIDPAIEYTGAAEPLAESDGRAICENEEYTISIKDGGLSIEAKSSKGILYGVFDVLRTVAVEKSVKLEYADAKSVRPSNPLRMLNHWDNMDGSIERGYSGESFFYENNEIIVNERTKDYARLIASVGINAVVINNVNVKQAASYMITDRYFEKLAELGEIFAGYGIGLFLSLNYASTIEI